MNFVGLRFAREQGKFAQHDDKVGSMLKVLQWSEEGSTNAGAEMQGTQMTIMDVLETGPQGRHR